MKRINTVLTAHVPLGHRNSLMATWPGRDGAPEISEAEKIQYREIKPLPDFMPRLGQDEEDPDTFLPKRQQAK